MNPESQPAINVSDWNGPDDPDNPHNWPKWQRLHHAIAPALLGFAVTFGTSVFSPAIPDVMRAFAVSRTVALLGITTYTLGLAFGPIITAPLSEGHGRKIVYLVSSPIFMLFTLGAGFSRSLPSLLICRLLAGMAGSPSLAVGAGTNADLFVPHKRAVATSMFLAAPFTGPVLGPVIGGFLAQYKTWPWTQWVQIFITLIATLVALPMKETYKPIILKKRARKHGLKMPDAPKGAKMKTAIVVKVVRPLHMLVAELPVLLFSLYTSFAFGTLFLFFAAFPFIFTRAPYAFSPSQSGLTFLSIGIGIALGVGTAVVVDKVMYQPRYQKALAAGNGYVAPEQRLYCAMMGSFGMVAGLFWFGWMSAQGRHWAVCLVGAVPFAWGNICVFTSTALYLVDVYGPQNGASAMAANGVLRYSFGAVFPLFTVQMYQGLGIGWATSLLGFVAVLLLPIPWVFFKWGPSIRAKSKYLTAG
ncbi:MFS multidrug transporter-like protein [Ophiobolus disseminans]|uniref:MFS multidrug transporter-like protein n=1 Tax=Ophiobolus disseminans TaxID=1469910 RepID=A0A6A7AHC5_9PLEO|nr:MFS multidrug transporter-like protein [Ophiobolus disseminans]